MKAVESSITGLYEKKPKAGLLLAAFGITFFLIVTVYVAVGVAPFGDRTLIFADGHAQYICFWVYARDVILGNQDAFYALEKTIGGNMMGLLAYYCMSPFNLLLVFFPLEKIPLALHLIFALKMSFCSLTMAIFFGYTRGIEKKTLLFTTAYGLCAYNTSFFWCAMWMDGVILLPLVALGLHYIIEGKKPYLYIFSLGCAIIFNYYTGYMLCIFSVMYFAYLCFVNRESRLRTIAIFSFSSLAAGGTSAFILLPAMVSMQGGKRAPFMGLFTNYTYTSALKILEFVCPERAAEHDSVVKFVLLGILVLVLVLIVVLIFVLSSRRIGEKVKILSVVSCVSLVVAAWSLIEPDYFFMHKLLIGFTNFGEMMEGLPNIYTGILVFVLAIYYFMAKTVPGREKIGAFYFIIIMFLSMRFYVPNLIWHGLTENSCFNYRYTFILSFFLITVAHTAMDGIRRFDVKNAVLITSVFWILIIFGSMSYPRLAENWQYAALFIALILIMSAFILAHSERMLKKSAAVIAAVHILTLAYPCYVSMCYFSERTSDFTSTLYSEFLSQVNQIGQEKMTVATEDGVVYRSAIGGRTNDPMLFSFNGISHFSSTEKTDVVDFMKKMGISTSSTIWANGNHGRSRAYDSLFGVRYLKGGTALDGYERMDGTNIYSNPYALPFAFMVSKDSLVCNVTSENAFENINTVFNTISQKTGLDIFIPAESSIKSEDGLTPISDYSCIVSEGEEYGQIVFKIDISSPDPLYLSFENPVYYEADVYLNGELVEEQDSVYKWRTMYLGSFQPNESIEVCLRLEKDYDYALNKRALFYYESTDALARYHEDLSSTKVTSKSIKDSNIISTVDECEGGLLLYTIPYDTAWTVLVDGQETEPVEACGIFMAVPVGEGTHTVELSYMPEGLISGAAISCIALASIAVYSFAVRKKQGKTI